MKTEQDKIYFSSFQIRKKLDLPIAISSLLNVFQVCINDQGGHYNSFFAVTNQELFDISIELQKAFTKFSKSEKIYHYAFCVQFLRTVIENNLIQQGQQYKKYVFEKRCMEVRGYQRPSMLSLWEKILVVVNFEDKTLTLVNKAEEKYNLNLYYMRESKDPAKFSLIFDSIVPNSDKSSIRVGFDSKNFNEVKIKLRRLMQEMEKERLFQQLLRNFKQNPQKQKTVEQSFQYLTKEVVHQFKIFSQQILNQPSSTILRTELFKASNKKISAHKGIYYLQEVFLTKKQFLLQSLRVSPSKWNNLIKESMIIERQENGKLQVIFYKFGHQDKVYESMILTQQKNTQDEALILFRSFENIKNKNAFRFQHQVVRVKKVAQEVSKLTVEVKIDTGEPNNQDFVLEYLIEFSNLFEIGEPQNNRNAPYLKKLSYMSHDNNKINSDQGRIEETVYIDAFGGTEDYEDLAHDIQGYGRPNQQQYQLSSDFKSSKESKESQSTHVQTKSNNLIHIPILYQNMYDPLSFKHTVHPLVKDQPKRLTSHFLDAEWKRSKIGTLLCTNKQVLSEQKKVAKHLLATFGKNILKIKGFLNISLPVSICCKKSHLQLIALNYAYAPLVLEPYANADPFERMKRLVIFNMTVGSTGIAGGSQKPFNPILGETYQAVINGCNLYLQQISHHPAISAYFFEGRGYKCYGSIQPKIEITGLNSGRGYSDRQNKIEFQDGSLIFVSYPKMFAKGFLFGEREFSFDSKNFIYDQKNLIFTELYYGPRKTSFFGNSDDPSDYVHGKIYKVIPSFDDYFKSQKNKGFPQKQHIVSELGVIDGLWTNILRINGSEVYNFRKQLPAILQDYTAPLPSNSSFRLDLIRLIEGNLQAAQEQKQRGEDAQRKDKNLRQKYKDKRNKNK